MRHSKLLGDVWTALLQVDRDDGLASSILATMTALMLTEPTPKL
jgi:hypothetical protein